MKVNKKAKNRKIIVSIITVIFAVALYIPYIPKMKALSNVTSSNNYGGYTWQVIDTAFDMDGNVTLSSAQISMNLNGHYNGAFTINISLSTIIDSSGIGYTNTINNYGFICNGCIINGYDASHLYVSIYDCNYWEIQIIPIKNATVKNWKAILNALDISSITGWSMTKLDDITATQITTIQNKLTSINSNISTTNSRLTTTNTELHNIYNTLGNSAQYGTIQTQLHGIAVNTTSMINELQDIDTHLSSYLTGTIDNQTINIWDLQNDANYSLSNIETALNTINSNINDYTTQLNTIQNLLSNIDTNLTNIDNTLDTISWKNFTYGNYVGYTSDFSSFSQTLHSVVNDNYFCFQLTSSIELQQNYLIRVVLNNVDKVNANNNEILGVYLITSSGGIVQQIKPEYVNETRFNTEVYLKINELIYGFTQDAYIGIKMRSARQTDTNKQFIQYIDSNDIEYWSLTDYFNQFNMNNEILKAINNINISVSNTTIQDTQTNITDYNTIYNQVSNVEQNYINEYNTNNTTLQSIINDKKGIPDNIINVSTDIESKMGQLFTVPEFKYLFALIISGCVLLALLG